MLKRRIKILLKILLALFVLVAVFFVFERVRGQISLARYKRQLVAKGEKMTARDLLAAIPVAENGAPLILEAAKKLQQGLVLPENYPPKMKMTPAGRAVVGFREAEWIEGKRTNRWNKMAADLKTNEQVLSKVRLALEMPVLNNSLDYSLGFKMPITNLASSKTLSIWFGAGSQLALHEGKAHEALNYLIPQIRLPRLLRDDRIVISELVRIAVASIAKTATWEAVQADGWTDHDLASLQEAWQSQDFAVPMVRAFQGEFIFGDVSYELTRKSNKDTVYMLYGVEEYFPIDDSERPAWERVATSLPWGDVIAAFLKKHVYSRIWSFAWSHQDQRRYVEKMQRLLEITRTAVVEKSNIQIRSAVTAFDEKYRNKNFYDHLRYPETHSIFALSKVPNKALRAETDRSIAICAIALKRYQLRHAQAPASLEALVPEFLTSVPIDYMDGKPMKYHLNNDGSFKLYSVGDDGEDNAGDASLLPDKAFLWDRRDYVWPLPALPEEVDAYRKESARN